MIFCDSITYIKELMEEALSKKNKGLRKGTINLVEMMKEAGSRIEQICDEQHENELKNNSQYFS